MLMGEANEGGECGLIRGGQRKGVNIWSSDTEKQLRLKVIPSVGMKKTDAKEYVKMLYLSQLMLLGGNVAVIQPGYQAAAIKELLPLLPPVPPEGDPEGCGVDKDDGDGVRWQEGAAQMSGSEARSDRE